eukprot:TRINITY_DN110901_c0_g1_i1.p1 TRINITY_DN110901_c0_g1~~TRINITY_DN110901_c0_g1_i1.p1  ORF type:complete len:460 (-),score=161.89 TRINITY_DN110901_c0_g1_i1:167-1546(-)
MAFEHDDIDDPVEDFHDSPLPCRNEGALEHELVEEDGEAQPTTPPTGSFMTRLRQEMEGRGPVSAAAAPAAEEEEEVAEDEAMGAPFEDRQVEEDEDAEDALGAEELLRDVGGAMPSPAPPAPAEEEEEEEAAAIRRDLLEQLPPPMVDGGEEEDDDDVGAMVAGLKDLGAPGAAEEEVLADSLIDDDCSQRERELWQQVRPRSLRREAADLKALKLPNPAIARLMKLHPSLQVRTAEALDMVNYSTVLLLQAVVQAAARTSESGSRIQFQDIRNVCLSTKELHFMLPIAGTLDASATKLQKADANDDDADGEAAGNHGSKRGGKQAKENLDPRQGRLGVAMFAKASTALEQPQDGAEAGSEHEASGGERTPSKQRDTEAKAAGSSKKRKASADAEKSAPKAKAARKAAAAKPKAASAAGKAKAASKADKSAGSSSLLGFFKKSAPTETVDPAAGMQGA